MKLKRLNSLYSYYLALTITPDSLLKMVFKNTVKIKGKCPVDIFYKVYGSAYEKQHELEKNKPTLIWLHGGSGFNHSAHEHFIATLANKNLQVVLIDQRGHGRSTGHHNPECWSLQQWGEDIYTFCQTLNISHPIIGGISFGGVVVQSYLLQHPRHPAGIILCDTEAHVDKLKLLNNFHHRAK